MNTGRPRSHHYDIPRGLPVKIYKRMLTHEQGHRKREDELMEELMKASGVIRLLLRKYVQIQNTDPMLLKLLKRHKNMFRYFQKKRGFESLF